MKSRKDEAYTNGVIAVREKKLLRERLVRMCAMTAEEALRTLSEAGFGGGDPSLGAEELILADEREIDAFIRGYSPSEEVTQYLLAPRDFHNAKALVKAHRLGIDPAPLLGSEGNFPVARLKRAVETGDTEGLFKELSGSIGEGNALLAAERATGAEAGFLFDGALHRYFDRILRRGVCRRLFARRTDMTNLLTAFRAESAEEAKKYFLAGGTLKEEALCSCFPGTDGARRAFENSPYRAFVKKLCDAREGGLPFTGAERELASLELSFFQEKPYELSGKGTFLYYVLRRRAENENVRIVFVCLNAGLKESEIVRRLRG